MPSLDKHTKKGHALSFIKASNTLSISLASSRNNSILDENLSSTDLKDETYSELKQPCELINVKKTPEYGYTCLEDEFKTSNKTKMEKHVRRSHGKEDVEVDYVPSETIRESHKRLADNGNVEKDNKNHYKRMKHEQTNQQSLEPKENDNNCETKVCKDSVNNNSGKEDVELDIIPSETISESLKSNLSDNKKKKTQQSPDEHNSLQSKETEEDGVNSEMKTTSLFSHSPLNTHF